jgi:hypothetical protein
LLGSNIRLICLPEVGTGALCCFIRFLPCDSNFARGFCGGSSPHDQTFEFRQRREINLWLANTHIGADEEIHHPAGNRDDNARWAFDLEKLPSRALLYPPDIDLQAEIGMPPIMNFPFFPDMGRMNGQWLSAAIMRSTGLCVGVYCLIYPVHGFAPRALQHDYFHLHIIYFLST